ncbi:MAG: hypothetical protein KC478_16900, partial [Bacteriovoracaceae bacterium]|nr:hypothetical protein [Bacteriovoracaceae bacterium]
SGIKIYVISQKKEALLGFAAAAAKAQKDLTDILVWDIGGGSMQMTSYIGNNKFDIYEGKIASASFKKFVIEAVQNKDPKKVDSPNPISKGDSNAAIIEASKMAETKVPKSIKAKIKSKADVIGIGGVHYYSIRGQTGVEKSYNSKSLEETISRKIGKSNKEIGGDYASTDVSNLLLVKGYMDGLGIKEVHAFKINLADGMLIGEQLLSK